VVRQVRLEKRLHVAASEVLVCHALKKRVFRGILLSLLEKLGLRKGRREARSTSLKVSLRERVLIALTVSYCLRVLNIRRENG
jgi:hypothetical protein